MYYHGSIPNIKRYISILNIARYWQINPYPHIKVYLATIYLAILLEYFYGGNIVFD